MSAGAKTKSPNRLTGKDLINVGIYSAIYAVIIVATSMTGYIPIMLVLLCATIPLIGGIPFMLFLTKVKKFGMILIMSILMGILMLLTGMGPYALPVGIVSGLIAELVWRKANYRKGSGAVLACGFFSIWVWGNFIPLFLNPEGYFSTRAEFGASYEAAVTTLLPGWMFPMLLICSFVCGVIGGILGRALLKKHFTKAGIV